MQGPLAISRTWSPDLVLRAFLLKKKDHYTLTLSSHLGQNVGLGEG